MKFPTPTLLTRIPNGWKAAAAGAAVLAITATASAGFTHLPFTSGPSGKAMVATMRPLSDSTIAPLEALDHATEAVTERVLPTVVKIQVEGQAPVHMGRAMMPQDIPAPFRQFFQQGPMRRPRSQQFMAVGSGVIVSPNGYIVTNNHVVQGASKVQVQLNDDRIFPAKVVGTDKDTDLAVVKIDATGLTSADFGNSSDLQPGQTVLAIGDPLDQTFSVTRGIISALNRPRTVTPNGGVNPDMRGNFIQTDAPINHGNSGGPLVNIRGQVVGINTEMLTDSGGSVGIGLAIPSNLVKSVAADIIKDGKVIRGYLGITVTPLQPSEAISLHEPNAKGVLVNQVNAGSPAAAAGLKPYDVVTKFNGTPITNGGDLQVVAGNAAPGTKATVDALRDGKPMQFTVTMGDFANAPSNGAAAADDDSGNSGSTPKLGITVTPLTPQIRNQLQLPSDVNGLAVESVDPNSPAQLAGIGQGDVIEDVNQHPVTTIPELQAQLKATPAGGAIILMVHHQGSNYIIPVNPQP